MEKIPLSVVILTQNEVDNIERCLNSIAWSDDVIIIDDSSDSTVALAKKKLSASQLRVFTIKNSDNFAMLRNIGLEKAKHEWVLFLDADEEVSESLMQEIQKKLHDCASITSKNTYTGFYLRRKDFFLGRWLKFGETGDIKLLKLGKKTAGKWNRRVHEVWDIKGLITELDDPLLHYPHPTISEFLTRINRWTDLDAQAFFEQGVRSSWWKIIAYPKAKFIRNYIVKQGFRDGMPGLIMSLMMSFHSFLTRAKLYKLQIKS